MLHAISVGFFCFVLWLLLSGYFGVFQLLMFGVLSSVLVAFLAWRMETVDPEESPLRINISSHIVLYWPWLFVEVVKANLEVMKIILNPKLPISPTMISLRPSQRTDLGRVVYANSITLTPGTVTIYLAGNTLNVHSLTQAGADSLLQGKMDRQVSELEGSG